MIVGFLFWQDCLAGDAQRFDFTLLWWSACAYAGDVACGGVDSSFASSA